MILLKKPDALSAYISSLKQQNKSIGFVPTMGALHKGHLSLIETCKQQADITVCSIFVNPTQFNDASDFAKYPKTIEQDILLLEQQGTDLLFLPDVEEIYPDGARLHTHYNIDAYENILEGRYRPGHFQGVCEIIHRLLNIGRPDIIFFGQKDYQQCMVIQQLLQLIQSPARMVIQPTVREGNGLAMSSRNLRLSNEARGKATGLFNALHYVRDNARIKDVVTLQKEATYKVLQAGFEKVDYISIADKKTLIPVTNWNHAETVVLGAAFIEGIRLIDNMIID